MWHAARAEEKKVYSAMDMMRQRAERRREWIAKRSIDFTQLLRLTGVPCKMFHDTVQFEVQRSGGSLVPWRGHADNQVDRFDVRALLDYIPEYDNTHASARRRAQEEHELENLICFESYRALVEFARQGLSEEQALALVIDDLDNAPVVNMPVDVGPKNLPAGKGEYSHVGFAYEDGDGVVAAAPEEGDTGENVSDGAYEDLSPEREKEMDETAKAFGIHRYCSYRRFDLAEREEEKGRKRSEREKEDSRRGFTRKERRRVKLQKAKELAGANEWMIMKERGRESPSYDPYGSGRSRSRSPSPVLESTKEFITEIAVAPKEEVEYDLYRPPSPVQMKGKAPTSSTPTPTSKTKPRLTPQERLALRTRNQLTQQIKSDHEKERKKRLEKEREEAERIAALRREGAGMKDVEQRARRREKTTPRRSSRDRSRTPPRKDHRPSRSSPRHRSPSPRHRRSRSRSRDRGGRDRKRRQSPRHHRSYRSPPRSPKRRRRSFSRSRSRSRSRSLSPPLPRRTRRRSRSRSWSSRSRCSSSDG